jgi:GDPmannose 4,6-dehydratase
MIALITGITGQDGAYLAQFLIKKGYTVYGSYRRLSSPNFWRMEELGIYKDVHLIEMDLHDTGNIIRVLELTKPDEVYNLAAQSFVAVSFDKPILTGETTGLGVTRVLEGIRIVNPKIKFYQASSSEMFGKVQEIPQKETTPFYPRSPYAVAKLYGHWITINYREAYNIFTCSGILFNHESPLRGIEFVTRKISDAVARIYHGLQDYIELGSLDTRRDWGYAAEYVDAMCRMLQYSEPDNYVIATNSAHSVREFVEAAFEVVGREIVWKGQGVEETGKDSVNGKTLVKINPKYYRPTEVEMLLGDYSKAKKKLGWEPKTSFNDLVRLMVESDLKRVIP